MHKSYLVILHSQDSRGESVTPLQHTISDLYAIMF